MIEKINIRISAANPQMPLGPFHVFAGSAASFTICDIPLPLGVRKVQGVTVRAKNVDGETRGLAAVRVGSAWGATVPAGFFSTSGSVENGIVIEASGTDESGQNVEPWIIGAGDMSIMLMDGSIEPGEKTHEMHWHDVRPTHPAAGDVAPYNGGVYYFNGTEWIFMGGGGADLSGKLPVKPLPKYLHALAFDDPYKADAEVWYESLAPDAMGGACSAVRRGGRLYRNYDWHFDSSAEFVVRMSAAEGRHASVGVASLGAALTEDEAASGVYTPKYRALPGMTLDGINDAGVVCEINVDGGPKSGWHGDADDEGIHILAAVRWVLDHGESAQQAAEWIADHIIQPAGDMNFHFMVADATETYIVENGEAHDVTDGTKVLTNFAVYSSGEDIGGGYERYSLLAGGSDIAAVNWTNAYQSGNDWDSDFESDAQHAAAIEQWAAQGTDKEAHRGRTTASGKPWWQTVHTSEYNFAARTLKVAVQESGEYFTFAAGAKADVAWDDVTGKPETFPPSAHAHAQSQVTGLDAALAAKRDKTDEACYNTTFSRWAWSSDDAPRELVEAANAPGADQPHFVFDESVDGHWIFDFSILGYAFNNVGECIGSETQIETDASNDGSTYYHMTLTRTASAEPNHEYRLARREARAASAIAKFDADGNLVSATAGMDFVAPVSGKGLSSNDYADADKDEVAKVEKKADEFTAWMEESQILSPQPSFDGHIWKYGSAGDVYYADGTAESLRLEFQQQGSSYVFVATRRRVLRTGEALAPGLDDDGVPTDENVAELFSESNTLTRYKMADVVGNALAVQTFNRLAVTDATAHDLSFPAVSSGRSRDFALRLEIGAGSYTPAVTFPSATYEGDDFPDITPDATNAKAWILAFTETKANTWLVRVAELKTPTTPPPVAANS